MIKMLKDRDNLETIEGAFFTILGHVHPPDRVFAYLKYLPTNKAGNGIWERNNIRFQRTIPEYSAANVINSFKFLKAFYPEFLFSCPINNILMSAVPINKIRKLYYAECELQRLILKEQYDPLEMKLIQMVNLLIEQFDLDQENFGITGSIALQMHHPKYSDIDLIVFGRSVANLLANELPSFIAEHPSFDGLHKKTTEEVIQRKSKLFNLPQKDIRLIFERKWNVGVFKGTRFAILPVRTRVEVEENYGDSIYHSVDQMTIVAEILSAKDSWFNPAIYQISVLKIIKGPHISNIRMLVSWENFFANVAKEGETILAKGKLERVINSKTHETWYRILIGSGDNENEFILPYNLP